MNPMSGTLWYITKLELLEEIRKAATVYIRDMTSDNAQVLTTRLDIYQEFLDQGEVR